MILISNDFCHKRIIYNFDPYNVFLAVATNIPQRLKTVFVLQGQMRFNVMILHIIFLSVTLNSSAVADIKESQNIASLHNQITACDSILEVSAFSLRYSPK